MGEKYSYRIYGLNVLSDIECQEVCELTERPSHYDIIIELGSVSDEIKQLIETGRRSSYTNESMWFHIKGVATYWIFNGNRVIIELAKGADALMAKQYLLGSCLGMAMLQRDRVAIHGGTIVFNGQGIIFTGERGAGKSTITSALRGKGYPFVADDVSALEVGDCHYVHPGFPQQKLCEDAAMALGYELEAYNTLQVDGKKKYLIPTKNAFVDEKVPLKAIVELCADSTMSGIEVTQLKGKDRLQVIYNNIYRIEMKRIAGVNPEYFKKCLTLAKDLPVYRIRRQKDVMTVDQQIQWLEETFLKENLEA